ncbi:MAG: PorT family protein [FCB group bacterium]|nr:PorT family protein [FCB group bacterium]
MVKKLVWILLLALMIAGSASAEFDYRKIGVGLKTGFAVSNVDFYPDRNFSRNGFVIGVVADYPLQSYLNIQTDFLIAAKGFDGPDTTYTFTWTDPLTKKFQSQTDSASWSTMVWYFEIPVTAKFTIIPRGKYRPYITGGGFWALPVNKKQRFSAISLTFDTGLENVRKFDWGVSLGTGIDIKAGRGWLNFDVRYDLSTQSLLKNTDYYSRAWLFRVGYRRPLGAF